MRRRTAAAFTIAILVLGSLGIWATWTSRLGQRGTSLALQLETERQRNFMELVGHVQSLQGLLAKGLAAGSVRQNMLYMGEVNRRASLATSNFMSLPLPGPLAASTGKFLNQVGDFAHSIARSEAAGRSMNKEQRAELARLQEESALLSADLQQVGRRATQEQFMWVGPHPRVADLFTGWPPAVLARSDQTTQDQSPKSLLPGGLDQVGPQMDRLPVLVYDGPFSDHLQKRTPSLGGAVITEAMAQEQALTFMPNASKFTVVQTTKRNGSPPVFSVRLAPSDSSLPGKPGSYSATVDLTEAGGHLTALVNARPAGPVTLDLAKAKEIGQTYLDQHGYTNMIPTYGEAIDGFATVQYVPRERGVLIYPDQIKVRVALDNGEVVGVDARPYVMSHRDRGALEVPGVTREQAAKKLNPELQIQRIQMAMIPSEAGDSEILAYEFLGTLGKELFLVYVNAKSGAEERILQMLITDYGTLAL